MRVITFLFIAALMAGCSSPATYSWQDTRQPIRDDATVDLEGCRTYTARQYRPGIPAGEPYLKEQNDQIFRTTAVKKKEWRPDRSPFPTTNINSQPVHDVPVDYTGYPGELDYYPGYLDAIMEKCMADKGWEYKLEVDNES